MDADAGAEAQLVCHLAPKALLNKAHYFPLLQIEHWAIIITISEILGSRVLFYLSNTCRRDQICSVPAGLGIWLCRGQSDSHRLPSTGISTLLGWNNCMWTTYKDLPTGNIQSGNDRLCAFHCTVNMQKVQQNPRALENFIFIH